MPFYVYFDARRLGGDEFTVIYFNEKVSLKNKIKQLYGLIDDYNETHEYKISIAIGYAEYDGNNLNSTPMKQLFSKADENMYADKERQHAKR